jgi:uncharacterized membrane protein YdjX (TVP38/TMEM64 family)
MESLMTRFWSTREALRLRLDRGSDEARRARLYRFVQPAIVMTIASGLALAYLFSEGFRTEVGEAMDALGTGDVDAVRTYLRSYGVWAPIASLVLMILQALAAPVPGFLIVFANGLLFGVFWGGLLSLGGQLLAAIVCFWIARSLGRAPVEALLGRFGLGSADRWFAKWGTKGVLFSRMVPGVGFDAVSYAAGLTPIGFGAFILATTLGTAPQTFIYAYLGQAAPDAARLLLILSTAVLAAVIAGAILQNRRRAARVSRTAPDAGTDAHPSPVIPSLPRSLPERSGGVLSDPSVSEPS